MRNRVVEFVIAMGALVCTFMAAYSVDFYLMGAM
jgi:hypothetical protein